MQLLKKYGAFFYVSISVLICFIFALSFETFEGGADNYIHYRVSRYAFTYPELFLDHWGKPVFTLLSSPFAQFGFQGLIFFNVLCGVLASYFAFRCAQLLQLKNAWITALFTLAMPIYYIMMVSAMTEILFSFLIILSIYFFLREKYILSSILFSTLFLVRTEAYILYPFIIFAFAWKKQWKAIPFLGTFFMLYSLIGLFYFGDFLWLINQSPYGDASDLYGTGELFFFIKNYKEISGKPIGVLLFIGTLIAIYQGAKSLLKNKEIRLEILLIEGCFILYFAAHSYVWWSGTGASAGLVRVMAAIVPLMAISATRSIDLLSTFLESYKKILFGFLFLFSIYIFTIPFKMYPLPLKYGERENTIAASVQWFQQSKYKNTKVYFYDPLIYFLLDRNPFDHAVIKELIDDREHPENVTKVGEIIFYDMHFGPNEGRLPLENLMRNEHFKLIAYFEPLIPFEVIGGYSYGMLLFERIQPAKIDNYTLLKKYKEEKTVNENWKENLFNNKKITKEEFTPLLEVKLNEIENYQAYQLIEANIETKIENGEVLFVISIERDGKSLHYQAVPCENQKINTVTAKMDASFRESDQLKIYIWNKSKTEGVIQNFNVNLIKKTY